MRGRASQSAAARAPGSGDTKRAPRGRADDDPPTLMMISTIHRHNGGGLGGGSGEASGGAGGGVRGRRGGLHMSPLASQNLASGKR